MTLLTRRTFGAACVAAGMAACTSRATPATAIAPSQPPPRAPRADLHVHLFGSGDGGSGCRLSPRIRRGATFALLARTLRPGPDRLDRAFQARMLADAATSGLDTVALVVPDGVYDAQGRLAANARTG